VLLARYRGRARCASDEGNEDIDIVAINVGLDCDNL
jgi:hypothetical protein